MFYRVQNKFEQSLFKKCFTVFFYQPIFRHHCTIFLGIYQDTTYNTICQFLNSHLLLPISIYRKLHYWVLFRALLNTAATITIEYLLDNNLPPLPGVTELFVFSFSDLVYGVQWTLFHRKCARSTVLFADPLSVDVKDP